VRRPLVCITGVGAVSCLGTGVETFWNKVCAGETAIVNGLGRVDLPQTQINAKVGRAYDFSLLAANEAMAQANVKSLGPTDGFILATTTGQIDIWSAEFVEFLRLKSSHETLEPIFRYQSLGALLDSLCETLGAPGKKALVSSACSAATQSIALGAMWIRQGRVKRCLIGGVEILSDLTIEGFKSLQLLSIEPARPFDITRKGINLSEGAGFLVLEADENQTAPALAHISGYGLSTDAFHMTGPHPEGAGTLTAMSRALESANLKSSDISWVHAHGTGSQLNDLSEGRALHKLFGETDAPPVTSTKFTHGHALGASGALESILCIEALKRQIALKTAGLTEPDPQIHIRHLLENQKMPLKHILKNTLGFGGINASLILSQARKTT
jgi:3-oxoacyl-(acyl-carrier-protein) synthase